MSDPKAADAKTSKAGKGDSFQQALDALNEAAPFAKPHYQPEFFRVATELLASEEGLARLRREAQHFETAGVFHATPWAAAGKLLPSLVGAGLRAEGAYGTTEILSELRILAIAAGECTNELMDAESATEFLRAVMGLNLDLLYGQDDTEEARVNSVGVTRARRILAMVAAESSQEGLLAHVVEEIEQRAAQRPIFVEGLLALIAHAERIPKGSLEADVSSRLDAYVQASSVPTKLARESQSLSAYRDRIRAASAEERESEAKEMGTLLRSTGLSNGYHAVLLRAVRRDLELTSLALGLSEAGRADASENFELLRTLVGAAIQPVTCDAIYGLAGMLDRALLSRPEVAAGIARLAELDLKSEVRATLLGRLPRNSGATANSVLVAGTLAMLGQPLGVGQGANPTCQAARGLSLWSLYAPGYLLELIVSACRFGTVEISFEGEPIASHLLEGGVADGTFTPNLDAISRILVPHLDRVYDHMMKLAGGRDEDAHKWVNPALYGRWVRNGFTCAIDRSGTTFAGYEDFLRLFFATHHPSYGDDTELVYPNPVGIVVTDVHGTMLGFHAISIQRVAVDGAGDLRVYFFNPNNEGRQRWGRGVSPTVFGHDEVAGESSLPFAHFAAHLYAFHFNPYEVGDGYAVPDETIAELTDHVRTTWGEAFAWPLI